MASEAYLGCIYLEQLPVVRHIHIAGAEMIFPNLTAAIAVAFALGVSALGERGSVNSSSTSLPVVDLGYELHQASYFNLTGNFYNFSNIRYAAPPTGENRFAAPKAPASNRSVIQTGTPDRICPQATPEWLNIADEFLSLYLAGQTQFNASSFNTSNKNSVQPPQDPRTTEDCLFLDVVVPKPIFDKAGKARGAAVLVWIYGGGYVSGSKTSWGNPAGLLARSENNHQPGVIVSIYTALF